MITLEQRPPKSASIRLPPVRPRRLVALLLMVAVCWGVLLATTPSPAGDPVLRTTSPGSTETVKSPDQIQLTFDRPVPAGLATIRVLNPPGEQVVFERPVHPDGREDTIAVPMPMTRYEGSWTVAWTLPSSGLEPLGGSFTFDVSSSIDPVGVPAIETVHDPTVTAVHLTARVAAALAMAVLIGSTFFVAAIWPSGARNRTTRRVIKGAWASLVVATAVTLLSFGPYAAWAPLRDAFDARLLSGTFESGIGGALLARLAVLIPITVGLAQLLSMPPVEDREERWLRGAAVLGCGSALAATWAFAAPSTPQPLTVAVDVVLVIAVGLGISGLFLLALMPREADRFLLGMVFPRFALLAVVCTGLLVIAGAWHLRRQLHGADAGGRWWLMGGVLALALTLAVVIVLGRRRAHPRFSSREAQRAQLRRLRTTFLALGGFAAVALGAAAVLVTIQPAQTAHAAANPTTAPALRDQVAPTRLEFDTGATGGTGSIDLVVLPIARDRLDTLVTVRDESGRARDDLTVTAVFTADGRPPVPVSLAHRAAGYAAGEANMPSAGRWQLALTVAAPDGSKQTLTQLVDVR